MNDHNLLDYTEAYPEPFNPADLSVPIRLLTGLYLFMWCMNLIGIWVPFFNRVAYNLNLFDILYLGMMGTVVWASRSARRSNDAWIRRYRVGVWIGMVLIIFYEFLNPFFGYGFLTRIGYYLAFTGVAIWLIRAWRLRAQAGRWWQLWEQWGWLWAIGNLLNYFTYSMHYTNDGGLANTLFWVWFDRGVYGSLLLIALYLLLQKFPDYTEKERYVGRRSWLAFGALLMIAYRNIVEIPYVEEIVAALAVIMVVWTVQTVLKMPDRIHERRAGE